MVGSGLPLEVRCDTYKSLIDYLRWKILHGLGYASIGRSIWGGTQNSADICDLHAHLLCRLHIELEEVLVANPLDLVQLYEELVALNTDESAVLDTIEHHTINTDDPSPLDEQASIADRDEESEDEDGSDIDVAVLYSDEDFPVAAPWRDSVTRLVFAEARASIRERINIVSRPSLRSLKLLDMPDEILDSIFLFVKDKPSRSVGRRLYNENLYAVARLRLTCRRFWDISSNLLLEATRVSMSSDSLSRLDQISRHATMGKSIEVIAIDLSVYDSGPANDFNIFAMLACTCYDQGWPEVGKQLSRSKNTLLADQAVCLRDAKVSAMVRSWRQLFDLDPPEPLPAADLENITFLQRAHEEYKRRYVDQQMLLEKGSFANTIAAAFARMPRANKVALSDSAFVKHVWSGPVESTEDHDVDQSSSTKTQLQKGLFEILTRSREWGQKTIDGLESGPFHLLATIPISIHQAGKFLSGVDINVAVEPGIDVKVGNMLSRYHPELRKATLRLSHFHLYYSDHNSSHSKSWQLSYSEIHAAMILPYSYLCGPKLRTIELRCNWIRSSRYAAGITPHIALQTWSSLRKLTWVGLAVEAVKLLEYIGVVSNEMEELYIEGVKLSSGSWVEVLDVFHRKSLEVPKLRLRLKMLSGGEIHTMDKEARRTIFGDIDDQQRSLAEDYARGRILVNPLREYLAKQTSPDPVANQGSSIQV